MDVCNINNGKIYSIDENDYSYKFKSGSKFFEDKGLTKFDGCDPEVYVCEGGPQWTMNVWVERSSNSIGVSGKISEDEFFEN